MNINDGIRRAFWVLLGFASLVLLLHWYPLCAPPHSPSFLSKLARLSLVSSEHLRSPQLQFSYLPPLQISLRDDRRLQFSTLSTRDCAISRTPGQHLMFEQEISDFKLRRPNLPLIVIFSAPNSSKVISDMTSQLALFSELLGNKMLFVAFGIDTREEDAIASQMLETSTALHDAKVLHRVQYTSDLKAWTRQALLGYMNDFEAAIVLRGVICATDLARLVMHSIDNGADIACSVDVTFSPHHLISSNPFNLARASGKSISSETIFRSRRFIQTGCCDGSAKVISFRAIRLGFFKPPRKEWDSPEDPDSDDEHGSGSREGSSSAKIMISPSVKSSADPDDFRSAIQLGFTDLQGFDYKVIEWKENKFWDSCAGSI